MNLDSLPPACHMSSFLGCDACLELVILCVEGIESLAVGADAGCMQFRKFAQSLEVPAHGQMPCLHHPFKGS